MWLAAVRKTAVLLNAAGFLLFLSALLGIVPLETPGFGLLFLLLLLLPLVNLIALLHSVHPLLRIIFTLNGLFFNAVCLLIVAYSLISPLQNLNTRSHSVFFWGAAILFVFTQAVLVWEFRHTLSDTLRNSYTPPAIDGFYTKKNPGPK